MCNVLCLAGLLFANIWGAGSAARPTNAENGLLDGATLGAIVGEVMRGGKAAPTPTPKIEEERLQRFWHDYYDAQRRFYGMLDRLDWVAYYKYHGYQINTAGGAASGRIQFAPVFVSPTMQWAVPGQMPPGPPLSHPMTAFQTFPTYGGGQNTLPASPIQATRIGSDQHCLQPAAYDNDAKAWRAVLELVCRGGEPSAAKAVAKVNAPSNVEQIQVDVVVAQFDGPVIPQAKSGWDVKPSDEVAAMVQTLRKKGLATIIAEPRLLVLSGQRANFCSGGEVPIVTPSGSKPSSISYKPVGTVVEVVAVKRSSNKILMNIRVELCNRMPQNDVPGPNGTNIPGFETQQVQTAVELEIGKTVVIAGSSAKSTNDQRFKEQVVLVTPTLVGGWGGAEACEKPLASPARPTLTPMDVVSLTKAGAADDIILRHMEQTNSTFRLTTPDLLFLLESGVSAPVIRAMQERGQPRP